MSKSVIVVAVLLPLFTACLYLGVKYQHGGKNYTLAKAQIDYYKRTIREIDQKMADLKAKGKSELDLLHAKCKAYRGYILNAPDELASKLNTAKEILEYDERIACNKYKIACEKYENEKKRKVEERKEKERREKEKKEKAEAELAKRKQEEKEKVAALMAQRESRRALSLREAKDGRCQQERYNALQSMIPYVKKLRDDVLYFITAKVICAVSSGTPVEMDTFYSGEIHIFAIGYQPIELDVVDSNGYQQELRSRLLDYPAYMFEYWMEERHLTSRVINIQSFQGVSIKVKGTGCSLIAFFRHF